jgi:adenylate cyclase
MEPTPPTNAANAQPASRYRPRTMIGRWALALAPTRATAMFRRHRRSHWVPKFVSLLICCVVFALVVFVNEQGWLQRVELPVYDIAFHRTSLHHHHTGPTRVAVIGVTEDDLQSGRVQVPMSDAQMTRILDLLLPPAGGGARAVGLDIYRDHLPAPDAANPAAAPVERKALITRLKDSRVSTPVLLSSDATSLVVKAPVDVPRKQWSLTDQLLDDDEVSRRALLVTRLLPRPGESADSKPTYRSLGLNVALAYLRGETPPVTPKRPSDPTDYSIHLGRAVIAPFQSRDGPYVHVNAGGTQMVLDFAAYDRIPTFSVTEVLDGKFPPDAFAGRAVFIGIMSQQSVKDDVRIPVRDKKIDGVLVHAMTTDQILRQAIDGDPPVRFWPDSREYAWAAMWTLLGGAIGFGVRVPWRFALALAGAVLLGGALLICVIFASGIWVPALPALIGCLAAAGFVTQYVSHHERAERSTLNELFKRMVDEDVAQTLWDRRDELLEEGHLAAREVRATVLFTDLEGFTTITESMDKQCLMSFLNDYMATMSGIVAGTSDAFVNKYIGDSIMAVYGPPLDRDERQARADAVNAIETALEMRRLLALNRERWERTCADGIRRKTGATDASVSLRMRVGIQSGLVTAGSLGGSQRLEYTVIGDTVNTASRLESYDKDVMPPDFAADGCRILIGQDTFDLLPAGEYLTREVGSIGLKGKHQRVTIHGVIGRALSPRRDANMRPRDVAEQPPTDVVANAR